LLEKVILGLGAGIRVRKKGSGALPKEEQVGLGAGELGCRGEFPV